MLLGEQYVLGLMRIQGFRLSFCRLRRAFGFIKFLGFYCTLSWRTANPKPRTLNCAPQQM